MYAIAMRHNPMTPWTIRPNPLPSEADARAEINHLGKYDAVGHEYRIVPLGDADAWPDPVREQAERLGVELPK